MANGTAPDASKLTAVRVIVMKSTDINAMHAAEEREWQRGLGGLVKTVDGNTVTVASGAKTLTIHTTPETVSSGMPTIRWILPMRRQVRWRRFIRAISCGRAERSRDDRLSMIAKEVVTGSFEISQD